MKIEVKVKPNSKKQEIIEKEGRYIINLKSKAEYGKANIELLKLFKKKFGKELKIIKGMKTKNKVLECR